MKFPWLLEQFARLLNRLIQLDPELPAKLGNIEGKHILIDISGAPGELLITVSHGKIQIQDYADCADTITDLTLRGSAIDFIKMSKASSGTTSIGNITLEGDTELASKLQNIAQSIDIDWEEQLAKFTGDIIAHRIGRGVQALRNWTTQTGASFCQNVNEYVHDEVNLFPTAYECEELYNDIDTLRTDADRLSARFQQIKAQQEKS